eukprot:1139018-Pelagomonas_calceolata.AAC.11
MCRLKASNNKSTPEGEAGPFFYIDKAPADVLAVDLFDHSCQRPEHNCLKCDQWRCNGRYSSISSSWADLPQYLGIALQAERCCTASSRILGGVRPGEALAGWGFDLSLVNTCKWHPGTAPLPSNVMSKIEEWFAMNNLKT